MRSGIDSILKVGDRVMVDMYSETLFARFAINQWHGSTGIIDRCIWGREDVIVVKLDRSHTTGETHLFYTRNLVKLCSR